MWENHPNSLVPPRKQSKRTKKDLSHLTKTGCGDYACWKGFLRAKLWNWNKSGIQSAFWGKDRPRAHANLVLNRWNAAEGDFSGSKPQQIFSDHTRWSPWKDSKLWFACVNFSFIRFSGLWSNSFAKDEKTSK